MVGKRKKGDTLDVRFFGGYHQKATVEKGHVKPITVNVHTLQVKRTSLWNKACEELRKHQEYLAKYKNDESFHAEPYGNHFLLSSSGGDVRSQWVTNFGGGGRGGAESGAESEDDDDDDEAEQPGLDKSKTESKIKQSPAQAAKTQAVTVVDKKKIKKGKGKKMKKVSFS